MSKLAERIEGRVLGTSTLGVMAGVSTRRVDEELAPVKLALQRMRTEFYAHDCLNNPDCRKCRAIVEADAAMELMDE